MMEFLFLDLDDTILDFHKAERIALKAERLQVGEREGLHPPDDIRKLPAIGARVHDDAAADRPGNARQLGEPTKPLPQRRLRAGAQRRAGLRDQAVAHGKDL